MIRHIILLFLVFHIAESSFTQTAESKLTLPSSPAFSILHFEPAAVMRPTSNKDLAADILNSFDKDGKLQMNLGLEVTPYWLKSRPTLTREEYLRPGVMQTILQSFSFSAATVRDSLNKNKLGMGFRFKLLNGEPVDKLDKASSSLGDQTLIISILNGVRGMAGDEITSKQESINVIVSSMIEGEVNEQLIRRLEQNASRIEGNYTNSADGIKSFIEQLITDWNSSIGGSVENVVSLLYQRKGLLLEFAGASGHALSNNYTLENMGIWGNLSYYVSSTDLLSLTARYMFKQKEIAQDSSVSNFDLGVGFLKQTSAYNISLEGMLRWYKGEIPDFNLSGSPIQRVEKDFTYRLAFQASYNVAKDISVNLSLGKEFNSPFISRSGFFSIFGVNYSLFNKEQVEILK